MLTAKICQGTYHSHFQHDTQEERSEESIGQYSDLQREDELQIMQDETNKGNLVAPSSSSEIPTRAGAIAAANFIAALVNVKPALFRANTNLILIEFFCSSTANIGSNRER